MIITIGRECGCAGDEIGLKLAEMFNLEFMAKLEITALAKEKGIYDEYPMFFGEEPMDQLVSSISEENKEKIHKIPYKVLSQLIDDKCVIVGRASRVAYEGVENVVNVFLCGDRKSRIDRIVKKHDVSEHKAKKIVDATDLRRRDYNNYYSYNNWDNASSYDICINMTRTGIDGAVELIASYIKLRYGENVL